MHVLPQVGRSEWLVLTTIILVAAFLRLSHPERMAVEHFDEGVYASNIWFPAESRYGYPARHLYAPPLLPSAIEWGMILLGSSAWATMGPNLVAGFATIVVVWRLAREWFGEGAGLAAATLIGANDLHALYSRTALTDPLLLCWIAMSLYALSRAVERRDLAWGIAGGALAGLAWLTKYNGWLPLGVMFVAIVIAWCFAVRRTGGALGAEAQRGSADRPPPSLAMIWASAAVVAGVMFGVYVATLQPLGGYGPVAANHRGYVTGLTHWPDNIVRQWWNLRLLEGCASWLAIGAAVGVSAWRLRFGATMGSDEPDDASAGSRPDQRSGRDRPQIAVVAAMLAIGSIGLAASFGSAATCGLWTLVGIGGEFASSRRSRMADAGRSKRSTRDVRHAAADARAGANDRDNVQDHRVGREIRRHWGTLIVGVMFFGLLAATPLYYAYPRLTLPWQAAAWLGATLGIDVVLRRGVAAKRGDETPPGSPATPSRHSTLLRDGVVTSRRFAVPILVALVALTSLALWRAGQEGMRIAAWQDRAGIQDVASRISKDVRSMAGEDKPASDAIVFVYGEPALFFHLRAAGLPLSAPEVDLSSVLASAKRTQLPVFLAFGPNGAHDESFRRELEMRSSEIQRVRTYPCPISDLVLTNLYSPGEWREARGRQEVALYRVQPAAN